MPVSRGWGFLQQGRALGAHLVFATSTCWAGRSGGVICPRGPGQLMPAQRTRIAVWEPEI